MSHPPNLRLSNFYSIPAHWSTSLNTSQPVTWEVMTNYSMLVNQRLCFQHVLSMKEVAHQDIICKTNHLLFLSPLVPCHQCLHQHQLFNTKLTCMYQPDTIFSEIFSLYIFMYLSYFPRPVFTGNVGQAGATLLPKKPHSLTTCLNWAKTGLCFPDVSCASMTFITRGGIGDLAESTRPPLLLLLLLEAGRFLASPLQALPMFAPNASQANAAWYHTKQH